MTPTEARAFIEEQAWDEGIWFIPVTASEGYLQQKLRALHSVAENLADQVEALENPPSESAIRASERERCAALCESLLLRVPLSQIPKAIRELGDD